MEKPELKKVYEGNKKFVEMYGGFANMAVYRDSQGKHFVKVEVTKDLGRAPTATYPAWIPYGTIDDAVEEAKRFEKKYFK